MKLTIPKELQSTSSISIRGIHFGSFYRFPGFDACIDKCTYCDIYMVGYYSPYIGIDELTYIRFQTFDEAKETIEKLYEIYYTKILEDDITNKSVTEKCIILTYDENATEFNHNVTPFYTKDVVRPYKDWLKKLKHLEITKFDKFIKWLFRIK